jgi:hypothetical protein
MGLEVLAAFSNNREGLLTYPNVVGVGIGRKVTDGMEASKDEVVTILVEHKLPLAALGHGDILPPQLHVAVYNEQGEGEGRFVDTDVVQVGRIRALKPPTDKFRPAPGGVSIGHYAITAGTFGCVVKLKSNGQRVILSNNHVLADSNEGVVGDSILQPGPYDGGGMPGDIIGALGRFIRIDFGEDDSVCPYAERFVQLSNKLARILGSKHQVRAFQANPSAINYVDAAIAIPTNDIDVLDIIWGMNIIPDGVAHGFLGMDVAKFGRTTKYTEGVIQLTNVTVMVSYGGNKVARFDNQFVAGPMSAGGDSGSLVIERGTTKAVGLLFAGSDQSTIFNPIDAVLSALDVEF